MNTRRFGGPVLIAVLAALAAVAATALLVNIFQRQQEARNPFYRVVELNDETADPAVWGKNFPLQYDGYQRTVDQVRTRYGGSEAVPRTPSAGRSALGRRAVAARRRSAAEDDVGGLRVRDGLPRGARPRVHARRSDVHRAAERRAAAGHVHALPRVGLRAVQEARRRRSDQGLRGDEPDDVPGGAEARVASGGLHRLPRSRARCSCA